MKIANTTISCIGKFSCVNWRVSSFLILACHLIKQQVAVSPHNLHTNATWHQSINHRPIDQSTNRSINQSINQSSKQSINQWINQSINQSIDRSINRSINQSINQSIKSVKIVVWVKYFALTSQVVKIISNTLPFLSYTKCVLTGSASWIFVYSPFSCHLWLSSTSYIVNVPQKNLRIKWLPGSGIRYMFILNWTRQRRSLDSII